MSKLARTLVRRAIFGGAILGASSVGLVGGMVAGAAFAYWGLERARRYQLAGKCGLITGGSRGLGLALARRFLRRGAKVALLGRDPEALQRAQQLLVGQGTVFTRNCDVRDRAQVEQAVADVKRELGEIDVLVNNAGTVTVGPMDTMTVEDFQEALNIYFWAPLYTSLAVLPSMRQRRTGRLVNISSIGGKISVPHLLPYSAGKFALSGLSEGLRAELTKENVYVTTVYPGLMRTGSPRNSVFKGKHHAEYTWFLLSDSLPLLSVNADRAARKIVRACELGSAELIISLPATIAIKAHALFPNMVSLAMRSANRLLPTAAAGERAAKKGAQSETALTESWLTALDERAAKKNNQVARPLSVNI
jgi:short-subunit dehydrogenase